MITKFIYTGEDRKFSLYTPLPNSIIDDERLSLCSQRIMTLLFRARKIKGFKPAKTWLIKKSGTSQKTVERSITELKKYGYIKSKRVGHNKYEWTIYFD